MNRTYLIKNKDVMKLINDLDIFDQKVEPFLKSILNINIQKICTMMKRTGL